MEDIDARLGALEVRVRRTEDEAEMYKQLYFQTLEAYKELVSISHLQQGEEMLSREQLRD